MISGLGPPELGDSDARWLQPLGASGQLQDTQGASPETGSPAGRARFRRETRLLAASLGQFRDLSELQALPVYVGTALEPSRRLGVTMRSDIWHPKTMRSGHHS